MDDPATGGAALVGPAGVGKSRLALQAAELAALRGLLTIAIRATRSAAGVPFGALTSLFSEIDINLEDSDNPFRAVNEAIDRRRGDQRLVLVVDDAQELDDSSVAMLDQIVGRPGIFVVLTVRTGTSDPLGVLDLWKEEQIIRLQVEPLDDDHVRQLIATALGGPVDGAALRALVDACRGNVLLLREIVQGALESGALSSRRGIWRLSGSLVDTPRLRDLIDHRFRGLGDAEREALELVALGEPLPLTMLASLVPLEVVELLERRGVLTAVLGDAAPEVRLAHPLYGEAVRTRLSPVRRARLCRELADAAERSGDPEPRDRLRIAVWQLDGGGGGNPNLALAAARAAFRGEDYHLAARLARSAWQEGRLIDAALMLADALDVSRGTLEASRVLREAYVLASTSAERTSVAIRLASGLFVWFDRADEAFAALDAAEEATDDKMDLRSLRAERGALSLLGGDVARSIEINREILDGPHDREFAHASRDLGVALALAGQSSEAISHTERALATRSNLEARDELTAAAVFLVARSLALIEAGRVDDAVESARAGYDTTVAHQNLDGQGWFSCILGFALLVKGQLATADLLFREAAAVFAEIGHPGKRWGLGGIALAAGQRGDKDAATTAIAELDALGPTATRMMDAHIERGRAWGAIVAGDLAAGRSILWDAVTMAEQWGQLASAAAALHDLVRIGDGVEASKCLVELRDHVDGDLTDARIAHALAVVGGEPDQAADAAERFDRCGATLFAAEAAVLERRLSLTQGLNRRAAAAGKRAERLAARCEGARTPALVDSDERSRLSVREREVAMLAAQGLASREIAERLFVSTRTVDNHLQRTYQKLGITGRAELADVMEDRSLD